MTMATYTTKLNLKKPDASELAKIQDINDNMDLIDSFASDVSTGKATTIHLTSTDTTWPLIWAKLDTLTNAKTATIYIHSNDIGILTDGNITTGAWMGTITRSATGSFSLMIRSAGGQIRTGTISGASSSGVGSWEDIRYASFSDSPLIKSLGNINNNTKVITNTGTATVRCLLIGSGSSGNREFLYMCVIPPSGSHYATQIYKGSNITVSASSSGISVGTNASYATAIYAISFSGNANDLTIS